MVCKPRQILFDGSIQGEKGKVHVEPMDGVEKY